MEAYRKRKWCSSNMSFVKNVFVSLSTKVFLFLISTAINITMARMLGPEGKGVYTLTLLVGSTLFTLGNFGLTSSVTYFTSKGKHELKDIVSAVLTLSLITGIGLSTLTILIIHNFSIPFLKGVNPLFITLIVLSLPFTLAYSYLGSVFLGKQKITLFNLIQLIERLVVLVVFFILFLFSSHWIVNAVSSSITSAIVSCIITLIFVSKMTKIRLGIKRIVLSAMTKYGAKVYFANMMLFGERKLDVFILNFFLNPAAVGYYSLATGIAEFLRYIPQTASLVLFPKIASSSKAQAKEYTPKVCRHIIFLMTLGCLVMGCLSELIINVVYGKAFLPALPVVWVFLPGMVFFAMTKVFLSDLLGRGKPMFATVASFVGVFSSVLLNFLLIPKWGMFGAAAAGVISYFLTAMVLFVFYIKVSGNRWIDMVMFNKDDLMIYVEIIKKMIRKITATKKESIEYEKD